MSDAPLTVFTVGHSNYPIDQFIDLLEQNGVQVIVDVRSAPYSRYNPQFDKNALDASLRLAGMRYLFLGKELGARSDDPAHYENGRVVYARLAQSALFKQGIERVLTGARQFRIALLCAEKEPLECHRTLLVARALDEAGVHVEHILADGTRELHYETMERLLVLFDADQPELFRTREEILADVLQQQEKRIAYVEKNDTDGATRTQASLFALSGETAAEGEE